jgi:hypothetical protein
MKKPEVENLVSDSLSRYNVNSVGVPNVSFEWRRYNHGTKEQHMCTYGKSYIIGILRYKYKKIYLTLYRFQQFGYTRRWCGIKCYKKKGLCCSRYGVRLKWQKKTGQIILTADLYPHEIKKNSCPAVM